MFVLYDHLISFIRMKHYKKNMNLYKGDWMSIVKIYPHSRMPSQPLETLIETYDDDMEKHPHINTTQKRL